MIGRRAPAAALGDRQSLALSLGYAYRDLGNHDRAIAC
jgi:hypothetical protein